MTHITTSTRPIKAKEIKRSWHLIDLEGKVLGRSLTEISTHLQGKNKRDFVPYLDCGDHVVVINAGKVKVTGKKQDTKEYDRYSGFPGGRKAIVLGQALIRDPKQVIRHGVSGMLPKNKLRDVRLSRLHIYEDANHPHNEVVVSQ